MSQNEKKYSRGYWMGVGISIGVAIGVAIGPLFDKIGIGIAVGIAIGSGIGASLEQRYKDNLRPLTEQEKKIQKWGVAVSLVILLSLFGLLIVLMFLRTR